MIIITIITRTVATGIADTTATATTDTGVVKVYLTFL